MADSDCDDLDQCTDDFCIAGSCVNAAVDPITACDFNGEPGFCCGDPLDGLCQPAAFCE